MSNMITVRMLYKINMHVSTISYLKLKYAIKCIMHYVSKKTKIIVRLDILKV